MNWKTEATDRLRQYTGARCAMSSLYQEVARIDALLCSPSALNLDAAGGGSRSKQEDWQLDQLVTRQKLQTRLEQTTAWVTATDTALNHLDQEERLILQELYIAPKMNNVDRLCEALNTERSSVYRKREKALEKFTLAMYGPAS